jgi:hypothetical protein
MNMSNKTYYTIGITVHMLNLLLVVGLRLLFPSNSNRNTNPVQYVVSVSAALI